MLDIKWIRDNPQALDAALEKRAQAPQSQQILALDKEWRALHTSIQEVQTQRNDIAKHMGAVAKAGGSTADLVQQGAALKASMVHQEAAAKALEEKLQYSLERLPNTPMDDVPLGSDAEHNLLTLSWGTPRVFDFTPKSHEDLGVALGLMDFEAAATLAGSRFVVLRGLLAKMERALAALMLDIHTEEFGYEEQYVPMLVTTQTMYGTAQLPKFGDDFFQTTDGRWLIPTAEAPLTNLVAGQVITVDTLPRRYVAYTPCFRSESGSAGRDTRGMMRQHQFGKVELVSITTPEAALAEHERMTLAAQKVLQRLGLPYRVMLLCTGDMGGGARKTYDLEVWIPSQNTYREISSCSYCGDYQARRMNARFKEGANKPQFVHTLNGSGVAVGRALIAVMENYQQADGSITIPEALKPYMGHQAILSPGGL